MRIRGYERGDAEAIVRLFYETVHGVNRADYGPAQLRAWAPEIPDPEAWHARMARRCTLVAEEDGEVVGFAELDRNGCLDMIYCRKDAIGRGVGIRLYGEIERRAHELGLDSIVTEASITARPFFERLGFRNLGRRSQVRRGIELTNFAMEKRLAPPETKPD